MGWRLLKRGEGSTLAQLIEPRGEKLRITYVKAILTAPADIRLVVVKVPTNQPGLYGLSCATFTQRARRRNRRRQMLAAVPRPA